MEILKQSIFHIDWQTSEIDAHDIAEDNTDLVQYLDDLLEKVRKSESKREFEFLAAGSRVKEHITGILAGNDFALATKAIAERLMQKESQSAADNTNLKHEIPKGFAIQILFRDDDNKRKMIITKSDDIAYLDKSDLKRHLGLPIEKKTYKTFLVEIHDNGLLGDLFVMDTTNYLAKYWWKEFLELEEKKTDSLNTKTAFDEIDAAIYDLKKKHPADQTILKNAIVGYFKTNEKFDMNEFLERTITSYVPEDPGLDRVVLANKIRGLAQRSGFDTQFNIIPEDINKSKIKQVIHLSGKMDLILRDTVEGLGSVITAFEEEGVKYIRIRTDEGYEKFKNDSKHL